MLRLKHLLHWYKNRRKKNFTNVKDTVPCIENFDPEWYLKTYTDVAASGIDPLLHYINHGQFEGRLPYNNRALAWEYHLWRGGNKLLLPRLIRLIDTPDATKLERHYAAWVTSRWYAVKNDWQKVLNILLRFHEKGLSYPAHAGPNLLMLEAALRCGHLDIAQNELDILAQRFGECVDLNLAKSNLVSQLDGTRSSSQLNYQRLELINSFLTRYELCRLTNTGDGLLGLDTITPTLPITIVGGESDPKVSVIVPTYNSEDTLITALTSLCNQTWRNLEVIIVDDASTDGTWRILNSYLRCSHFRPGLELHLIRHQKNQGSYGARNTALESATGDLITTHDSDDWSHPQKIEIQAKALLQSENAQGSISHWVRANNNLYFSRWFPDESWVHRNISSLMVRRSVIDTIGYWDRVSVNADTEYYYRLLKVFGEEALVEVLPNIPLSFGRITNNSLSQNSETHVSTRFVGLRKDYEDAARRWHSEAMEMGDLYLPSSPKHRPFLAPKALCLNVNKVLKPNPMDIVQQSGRFNQSWYLEMYPDLQNLSEDLFEHYWTVGASEGRDPGPDFSESGYRYKYMESGKDNIPALYHYLTIGIESQFEPLPEISGKQEYRPKSLNILLCAHQAGELLYGAERSFLDVLSTLSKLNVNLIVALPSALNSFYVGQIRDYAWRVVILPYGWWKFDRPANHVTLRQFEALITRFNIKAVYTNTLVLNEPLLAARAQKVPTLVHVRELPQHDIALCKLLETDALNIISHVKSLADIVLVNSEAVKSELGAVNTVVIPNIINTNQYKTSIEADSSNERIVRVVLISSNLPKKGLSDFVDLARRLENKAIPAVCILIGPENDYIKDLQVSQNRGLITKNLKFVGYATSPQKALAQADIVVNLSHFHESFGRTVLEAMASELPVVAYHRGAIPELVRDNDTGFLVPFGNIDEVADRINKLVVNRELRLRMGKRGRQRVEQHFCEAVMLRQLKRALALITEHELIRE
ncbi:glycosyltransferase [Microbulbifer sp. JMSA002]|uniref:glycosyltransferase n=1 Tax=Microbulbifer sp. JMSA002 TaxID=3243368 RepID=UPI00403A4238